MSEESSEGRCLLLLWFLVATTIGFALRLKIRNPEKVLHLSRYIELEPHL